MMGNKFYISIVSSLFFLSCSNVTFKALNRPIYKDLKKRSKVAYKEYGDFPPSSYKEFYENAKYEVDYCVNYRNKVIDSLNLFEKKDWIIIKQSMTNQPSFYEKTYILRDNEFTSYLLKWSDLLEEKEKLDLTTLPIEKLNNNYEKDIYTIYQTLNSQTNNYKVNLKPDTNPLIYYYITICKNKNLKFYKITSEDYFIKKW